MLCYRSSFRVLFQVKNQNEPTSSYKSTYTQDFINATKSLIIDSGKMRWKSNINIFQNKCYFFIFFCSLFLGMLKSVLNFQNIIAIIFHICFQFLSRLFLNVTTYCSKQFLKSSSILKEKILSKCYLTTSNFLNKLA